MGEEYYKAYVNKTVQDDPDSVDLEFLKEKFKLIDPIVVTIDSDSGFIIKPPLDIQVDGDTFIINNDIIGTVGTEDGTEEAVNKSEIKIEIW